MSEKFSVFATTAPALPFPFQASDIIVVTRAGVSYKIAPSQIRSLGPVVYVTPLTGNTITAIAGQGVFEIVPAGALASLTMILPPGAVDEQVFEAATTQDITALTVQPAAGDSVAGTSGGPFTLGANSGASWRYRASINTWFPRF